MKRIRLTKTEIATAVLVGVLFLAAAYASQVYSESLLQVFGSYEKWGMFVYVLVSILAVVIAPISATPLIPIATSLWGASVAGWLSITAWTIGAVIAFTLARRYGYNFVRRFVSMKRIQTYADSIPNEHLFVTVVVLRIIMPVDVLSYALGLFSKMSLRLYILATIIGVAPFAFVFSYVAHLPLWVQGVVLLAVGVFLYLAYERVRRSVLHEDSEDNLSGGDNSHSEHAP